MRNKGNRIRTHILEKIERGMSTCETRGRNKTHQLEKREGGISTWEMKETEPGLTHWKGDEMER